MKVTSTALAVLLLAVAPIGIDYAATVVEEFKIEGLISPASPKALSSALEEQLDVKVVGLNLKDTDSGWPVLSVEFDSAMVSKEEIEQAIGSTDDPAGHNYKVHKGPLVTSLELSPEEVEAVALLGPVAEEIPELSNPIPPEETSISHGKGLYEQHCAKCHGLSGNGHGPSAHGFSTWPRQLWIWSNTGAATDGYLFWIITNGRTDMPPWGIVLSENDRWNLINYIRTLKAP